MCVFRWRITYSTNGRETGKSVQLWATSQKDATRRFEQWVNLEGKIGQKYDAWEAYKYGFNITKVRRVKDTDVDFAASAINNKADVEQEVMK